MQNTLTKNYTDIDKSKSFLNSDKNLFLYIEKRLNQIFTNEMNSENSIFRKVKPSVIQKMALFLSKNITRSCSIGIAGETASGKSTIALDIINTIQSFADEYCVEHAITRINTDDYYFDRSDMVKKAGSFACRTDEPAHDPRREVAPCILLSATPAPVPEKLTQHGGFSSVRATGRAIFLLRGGGRGHIGGAASAAGAAAQGRARKRLVQQRAVEIDARDGA